MSLTLVVIGMKEKNKKKNVIIHETPSSVNVYLSLINIIMMQLYTYSRNTEESTQDESEH